jgi:uncharacterized protein YceK
MRVDPACGGFTRETTMRLVVPLTVLLAVAGCASSRGSTASAPSTGTSAAAASPQGATHRATAAPSHDPAHAAVAAGICPTDVPGTKAVWSEADRGAAVTFTTDQSAGVNELRRRVRAMADLHNQHHASAKAPEPSSPGPMGRRMEQAPSRARVEEIDAGARLVVTANDEADLTRVRETVRMHAQHMERSGCGHAVPAPK